jgi:hypothetical protein
LENRKPRVLVEVLAMKGAGKNIPATTTKKF